MNSDSLRRSDWETIGYTSYGWGINDVNYNISSCTELPKVSGRRKQDVKLCPYYVDWQSMLMRCFSTKYQIKQPTYKGCTICEEWRYLSNFIKWVDSQPNMDWENCELDKDFLFIGNKHYSPETTVYIKSSLNTFVSATSKSRGHLMMGVTACGFSKNKPYMSRCSDPFSGKQKNLGIFTTELEAHLAWQAKKHEHACRLADLQADPRIADALRQRYSPDKDWTKA